MAEPFVIHITRNEVTGGRDVPRAMESDLNQLLLALNKLRAKYGKPMRVVSGFRTPNEHIEIYKHKAAKAGIPFDQSKVPMGSGHLKCQACDFEDLDGELDTWCLQNVSVLEQLGLWLEHPDSTPGWTHLDTKPRSNRVFRP